jgi:hypothetical protein
MQPVHLWGGGAYGDCEGDARGINHEKQASEKSETYNYGTV